MLKKGNQKRNLETEGIKDIDIEIKYYDTLKISQTARGLVVLFFSIFYLPMTACLTLCGSDSPFLIVKLLVTLVLYIPLLYFVHKRKLWALVILLIIFSIDVFVLVVWVSFKFLILLLWIYLILQAIVVERERRKIVSDPNYKSEYLDNYEQKIEQQPVEVKTETAQKNTIYGKISVIIGLAFIGYSYYKTNPESIDSLKNLYTSDPSTILVLFFLVLFCWIVYIKWNQKNIFKDTLVAIVIFIGLTIFTAISHQHKQDELDLQIKFEKEQQERFKDLQKSMGMVPWYTEDKSLWIEDLDVEEEYRILVPPEFREGEDGDTVEEGTAVMYGKKDFIPEEFNSAEEYKTFLISSSTAETTKSSPVHFGNTIALTTYTQNSTSTSYRTFYAFDEENRRYHRILILEPYYSRDKMLFDEILRTFEPIDE